MVNSAMAGELTELHPIHIQVASKMAAGQSLEEVCEELFLTKREWELTVQSPLFLTQVENLKEQITKEVAQNSVAQEVKTKLERLAPTAVSTVGEILYSEDTPANARLRAAEMILDRTIPKTDTNTMRPITINFSMEKIHNIRAFSKTGTLFSSLEEPDPGENVLVVESSE